MSVPEEYTRLILVRHGEASGNRELRYVGSRDDPLTERGLAQAALVAADLARLRLDALYASPLARAAATARAIARACGLEPHSEPELRESDFGAWEGRTRAEVLASNPTLLRRWEADPDTAPPGGESLRATRERVVACVVGLVAHHRGQTIVLVSHVGPIKALVGAALDLGPVGARRMWLDPASLTILDWPATGEAHPAILRAYNATSHLGEPPRWLAWREPADLA